ERMRTVGARACLETVARVLEAKPVPEPRGAAGKVGRGVAVVLKSTLTPTATFGTVRLNADGSVDVITAAVEHGQGVLTVLAQMASEELSVPMDRVRCVLPDTAVSPFDRSSSSSRTVFTMGNAVRDAAGDVRRQLLDMAAQVLEASAEDLELEDGRVAVRGAPDRSVGYAEVIQKHYKGPGNVVGQGSYATRDLYDSMDPDTGQSARPTAFWMYAASGAEVEVDLE